MISIIHSQINPQNIKLSDKSKNLKMKEEDFWGDKTSPIFHAILDTFYNSVENDSNKFQEGGSHQSDVNNAIKRLIYDGILHQIISQKKGRPSKKKRDKKFSFAVTLKGLKFLIDGLSKYPEKKNSSLSRNFSDNLTIIFQKNNVNDYKILEDVCDYYESTILKTEREYIVPRFFIGAINTLSINSEYELIFEKDSVIFEEKLLKMISNRKSTAKSYIIRKFKNKKCNKRTLEKYLDDFLFTGIISKVFDQKNEKYELTFLGLIKIFHYFYLDSLVARHNTDTKKMLNIIKHFHIIRRKCSSLLPNILDDKKYTNLNLTPFQFLSYFEYLYFNGAYPAQILQMDDAYIHNVRRENLRKFDDMRSNDFWHILKKHIGSPEHVDIEYEKIVIRNITKGKKETQYDDLFDEFLNNSFVQLISCKELMDYRWLYYDPSSPSTNKNNNFFIDIKNFDSKEFFPQLKSCNDAIKRKITFDFYTVFASVRGGLNNTKVNNKIKKWYNEQESELLDYISNYSKYF